MIAMDTILVVNAGSSSVKFQIFTVEGEGGLRRQIKGQMDGIGSRPRLRASGSTGELLWLILGSSTGVLAVTSIAY